MPYSVNHSNGEIFTTVPDQTVNTLSSLSFVGKSYAGYGKLIADNFLHLLENFANTTEPSNPIEGQLWYDTTEGVQLLKVYNGTKWNPSGSIKKTLVEPVISDSAVGDLWVNTEKNQLFMFSGNTWDLIGPQFSSGLKTGPIIESIDDIDNLSHAIIIFYAADERLAIISSDEFTPKLSINGFNTIKRGINLSTYNISSTSINKLWGIAESADSLIVNNTVVDSSKFLRSDVSSTTNKSFSIQSTDGISIGSQLDFNITTDDTSGVINLTSKTNKKINIQITNPLTKTTNTCIFIDSELKVGIKTTTPEAELDVNGSAFVQNSLTVNEAITASGNLTVNGTSLFKGITDFSNTISLFKEGGGSVLLPKYSTEQLAQGQPLYDIGHTSNRFRNIYATNIYATTIYGDINGDITGNVTGSASKLSTIRTFTIAGDITSPSVSFNGTANVTFDAKISPDLVSSRPEASRTLDSDWILTYRPLNGIEKITKDKFLSTLPTVPVGAIFPYAGPVSDRSLPTGYLYCDGSEILVSTYPDLFTAIGYAYRDPLLLKGTGTFALPDLRGRFPLGRDNMDNNLTILVDGETESAGGNRNGVNSIGADSANRVHHASSKSLGSSSGNEALGTVAVNGVLGDRAATTTTGNASSIMNPYQTINYIIFTGKL